MEALADQYEATVAALKNLAKELRIRSATKLLQAARGRVPGANLRLAQLALEDSVSKLVLAPAYRSTGRSAAEGPNERIQADLIDMSQNTRTKERFALQLVDVYTRETRAQPLMNKQPATVNAAVRSLMPTLVEDKQDYAITTDKGKEFSKLERPYQQTLYLVRNNHPTPLQSWTARCRVSKLTPPQSSRMETPKIG